MEYSIKHYLLYIACKVLAVIGAQGREKLAQMSAMIFKSALKSRRKIIQKNLQLCFPNLSMASRSHLLEKNVSYTLSSYFEAFASWVSPLNHYRSNSHLLNEALVERLHKQGKGVILLGGHFNCMDIAGIVATKNLPIYVSYQPNKNPFFEKAISQGRLRWAKGLVSTKDVRGMIKILKAGGILWIAPDQDLGEAGSTFNNFFGVPTATSTASYRLAKLTAATVIPISFYTTEQQNSLTLKYHQALPLDCPDSFISSYHRFLEHSIRRSPEQYLWAHKRFKTRPSGEAPIYE